ncbi:MAG: hypothetical protein J7K08_07960 [Thermoplasmata archaeon]|nr:hypothetical protein [Thermoplasmata archaeon]
MKLLGVYTYNSELYFDLIRELRRRGVTFISIDDPVALPAEVAVVITGRGEGASIKGVDVVEVGEDVGEAVDAALNTIWGKKEYTEVIIGVDPGPRPGIAAVGDGLLLKALILNSPGEVLSAVEGIMRTYPSRNWLLRLGDGDPVSLKQIISSIPPGLIDIEVVDESGTTLAGPKGDHLSAMLIALKSGGGRGVKDYHPTSGEVQNVQRLSRIESGGKVTIDRERASKVLKGELSMEEAVREKLEEISYVKRIGDK